MKKTILLIMAFATATPAVAQDKALETGNTVLFGQDRSQPVEVVNQSRVACAFDNAHIAYTVRSTGARITSAAVNARSVKQSDIDLINRAIGSSRIENIDWKRCPPAREGSGDIVLYIMLSTSAEKRFLAASLGRDGLLRHVRPAQ